MSITKWRPPPFQKTYFYVTSCHSASCPQCTVHWEEHQPRGILELLGQKHYPLSRSVSVSLSRKNGSYNTFPFYVTDLVRIMKSWSVGTNIWNAQYVQGFKWQKMTKQWGWSAEMVMSLNFSSELGERPQKVKFVLNIHRLCRDESSAVSEPSGPGAAHTKADPHVTPAVAQPHHPSLSHCSHHPSTAQKAGYRGVSSHMVYSNQPPSPSWAWLICPHSSCPNGDITPLWDCLLTRTEQFTSSPGFSFWSFEYTPPCS